MTTSRPISADQFSCPVEATINVLGGKWKLLILYNLLERPMRFSELRTEIGAVSERILSKQLQEMEADGLVERALLSRAPLRVEYSLTAHGATTAPLLAAICTWGDAHLERHATATR